MPRRMLRTIGKSIVGTTQLTVTLATIGAISDLITLQWRSSLKRIGGGIVTGIVLGTLFGTMEGLSDALTTDKQGPHR